MRATSMQSLTRDSAMKKQVQWPQRTFLPSLSTLHWIGFMSCIIKMPKPLEIDREYLPIRTAIRASQLSHASETAKPILPAEISLGFADHAQARFIFVDWTVILTRPRHGPASEEHTTAFGAQELLEAPKPITRLFSFWVNLERA